MIFDCILGVITNYEKVFHLILLSSAGGIDVKELSVEKDPYVVGKEPGLDCTIPDMVMSRRHLQFEKRSGRWWLRDLNSTNGCYVNGQCVLEQELNHHDVIQAGLTSFLVNLKQEKITSHDTMAISSRIPFINPEEMPQAVAVATGLKPPVQQKGPVKLIQKKKGFPPPPAQPPPSVNRVAPRSQLVSHPISGVSKIPKGAIQKRQAMTSATQNYSSACLVCGCLGFIAFIPAIILGHMDKPDSISREKQRDIGLTLGYFFMAMWLVAGIVLMTRSGASSSEGVSEKTISESPQTVSASNSTKLNLPKNDVSFPDFRKKNIANSILMWMPSETLRKLTRDGTMVSSITDVTQGDTMKAMQEFPLMISQGFILSESRILRTKKSAQNHSLRLVLEDYLTAPTFWKWNTSVVPERKMCFNSFVIPEDSLFFYDRDASLVGAWEPGDERELPWYQAYRGVEWSQGDLNLIQNTEISSLRVMMILQSLDKPRSFVISTVEGRKKSQFNEVAYPFSVYPAHWVAAIVYDLNSQKTLSVKVNPAHYSSAEQIDVETQIQKHFLKILQMRPAGERMATRGFRLSE